MARVNVTESFSMAMNSLWLNKFRTFLTLLGIIIGVFTIIAVVSIIQGLNNYVDTKMAFFGANDFTVTKFSITTSLKEFREQMKRKDITLDEMRLLRSRCRSCELVGASVSTRRIIKFRNKSLKNVEIRGITYLDHMIGSVEELERGRHILKEELRTVDVTKEVKVVGKAEVMGAGVEVSHSKKTKLKSLPWAWSKGQKEL